MRLTLRTLMAWMDDTLPPKDVRRIGRQLERSKFSQDLSRRIRRVVRQRRLTVPGMGSNQPVDANIVAAYLDNNLPGESTSTYESLCLNSDVHLAEVAASHEILSVLDQPGSIAPETYASMYRIVKAPESRTPSDRPLPQRLPTEHRPAKTESGEFATATPVWLEPPFTRNMRRFIAVSVMGAGVLAFASISLDRIVGPVSSISPIDKEARETLVETESEKPVSLEFQEIVPSSVPQPADRVEESAKVPAETKVAENAKSMPVATNPELTPPRAASTEPVPAVAKAAGAETDAKNIPQRERTGPIEIGNRPKLDFVDLPEIAAIAESTILFTGSKDVAQTKSWSFWKIAPVLPVYVRFAGADSARFPSGSLSLAIEPGSLLEISDVASPRWLSGRAEADATDEGRIRLRSGSGRECIISFPKDAKFRIEAHSSTTPDERSSPRQPESSLVIRSLKGTLTVATGRTETEIPENRSLKIEKSGPPILLQELPAAFEVTSSPPPGSALVNRMIRRYLVTNRPLPTSIIDAESDELPDVRGLALKIALWIDREDIVTGVLTDLEKPDLRKLAISAVKEALARGEDSARRAIQGCVEELALADPDAELLTSLFTAPSAEESLDRKKLLVNALEHDARLIRQLALDRLMLISGRDSMGFDPDEPTAKGIEAWRSWIGMNSQGSRQ